MDTWTLNFHKHCRTKKHRDQLADERGDKKTDSLPGDSGAKDNSLPEMFCIDCGVTTHNAKLVIVCHEKFSSTQCNQWEPAHILQSQMIPRQSTHILSSMSLTVS